MNDKGPKRAVLIGRRWRAVAAATMLTFVLMFLAGRFQRDMLGKAADLPDWSLWVLIVTALALLFGLAPRRFIAALGLRHPFTYPPYWFGIAIGLAIALGLIANVDLFEQDLKLSIEARAFLGTLSIACASAPAVAFLVAGLCRLYATNRHLRPVVWRDPESPTREQFLEWILDDDPISAPAYDLFGHASIAQRIGRRLIAEKASAQALVGRLGSGKSTIRELVEVWLRDQRPTKPVEVIRIELWPYESPRAAVGNGEASLLGGANELGAGAHLYVGFGATKQNSFGVKAGFQGSSSDGKLALLDVDGDGLPDKVFQSGGLQALDDVATVIGRRYVLWVEDLERFAAGDPNAPAENSELERLAPIRALLHGLDETRSITVVTATTDLFRRFDLEKIARYVERIPQVSIPQARRILSAVRDQMVSASRVSSRPLSRHCRAR